MNASDELKRRAELRATELISNYTHGALPVSYAQFHTVVAAAWLYGKRDGLMEGAELALEAIAE